MAAKKPTVPVSKRALIARLNRKLRADDEIIKTTRGSTRARQEMGEFFVIDTRTRGMVADNIDLEDYGRSYECLQPYESLSDE
jgi:hypothetical protein